MKNLIKMTVQNFEIKEGTKTVWVLKSEKIENISERIYNNIIDSCSFMRRLGGSETNTKSYTCAGYKVVKNISTSPCRTCKTIRSFEFE